jgi:hypothetical protein
MSPCLWLNQAPATTTGHGNVTFKTIFMFILPCQTDEKSKPRKFLHNREYGALGGCAFLVITLLIIGLF